MPYVKRTVETGDVIETKKMFTGRIHTFGAKRAAKMKDTEKAQAKCNERKAEEKLRWTLNGNFGEDDLHAVLHYGDKPQVLEEIEESARKFLSVLKKDCKKEEAVLKYVLVIETKRMSNPHIHLVLKDMDPKIIKNAWAKTVGKAYVSVTMLDDRGNHVELANYLIKESRSTAARWRSGQKHKKRWWSSQNLLKPEPKYEIIPAKAWKKEPKARAGYALYKDKEGISIREGFHEISGYSWQEYFEVKIPEKRGKGEREFTFKGNDKKTLPLAGEAIKEADWKMSCCYKCAERTKDCHGNCEKYAAEMALNKKRLEEVKKERDARDAIHTPAFEGRKKKALKGKR